MGTRRGQVWSQTSEGQDEATPAEQAPGDQPEVAEAAEVADFKQEGTPPAQSAPLASYPALFPAVDEGKRDRAPHVTASVPRLVREAALMDILHRPDLS